MNTYLSRIIVIFVILSLLISSCGAPSIPSVTPTQGQDMIATGTAYAQATSEAFLAKYNLGITTTENEKFGILAAHTNGEKLAVITLPDQAGDLNSVDGAVWLSPEDKAFVVFKGEDGLPERVVIDDLVLIFSNYTDSYVDVTVVSPDKKVEVVRGVELNSSELLELRALSQQKSDNNLFTLASYPAKDKGDKDIIKLLKIASLLVSIGGCVAAAIPATALTFGAALLALALPCGGAIISTIAFIAAENPELAGASAAFNSIACVVDLKQTAMCLVGLLDIIASFVDASIEDSSEATALLESPPNVEPLKLVLNKNFYCRTGPDSSYPDVTGFFPGAELEIIGQNNGWYLVDIEKAGVQSKFKSCWIGGGEVVGGDLSAIPVVQPSNPAPGAGPSKNKPDKPNQPSGSSYP